MKITWRRDDKSHQKHAFKVHDILFTPLCEQSAGPQRATVATTATEPPGSWGCNVMISDGLLIRCFSCFGTGKLGGAALTDQPCPDCGGTGKVISHAGKAILGLICFALETGALTLLEPVDANAPIPYLPSGR